MRIFCSICKDIFIPSSEIFVTNCGHLYHDACISQWCKLRKTCPQCRTSLKSKLIRVYFDVEKENGIDPSTFEHQVEVLTSDLRQSEINCQNLKQENEKYERILVGMEENSVALKKKYDVLKCSVQALKDQVINLSKQNETVNRLQEDLKELSDRIKTYERLEFIMKSTAKEADKILQSTPITSFGIRQLSIFTSALKDRTEKDKEKLAQLSKEKKELQRALATQQTKHTNENEEELNKLRLSHQKLEKELQLTKEWLRKSYEKLLSKEKSNCSKDSQAIKNKPVFNISSNDKVDAWIKKSDEVTNSSKNLKNWEDIVIAGPSRVSLARNSQLLSKVNSSKRVDNNEETKVDVGYAFDGMGGRKKICLGHPTPADEFEKIKNSCGKKLVDVTKSKKIYSYYQVQ